MFSLDERREWWLSDVAAYLGVSRRTLYRLLAGARFRERRYRRRTRHPGLHRVLYAAEVVRLKRLWEQHLVKGKNRRT